MDQNDRYDNEKVLKLLTEANQFFEQNRDYPPYQIGEFLVEFCKLFKQLGKLLYFAFSDVIEKAQVIKDRGNEYNEQTKGIYGIIQIEKQKGLMELNGENNKEILKNKTLPNYQSMARTMLRIIRFFNYLKIMFIDVDTNRNKKFSDICSDAYNEALAPYHTFMVRNAAKAAWLAAPSRTKVFETFAGPNQTDEVAYAAIKKFVNALEPIRLNFWDYYNSNKLTNLP
ncbi:unnamed protein product [Paramecium pentaurelia]|uniref:Glycolipid transfer protein domain-containing protein n=1 Tax=Paramecium pentaurelia TaxID=43138 RepID=A0A8S1UZP6_9CILI|nr:unnamed protein product [Paramecium pentaurelia]